MKEKTYKLVDWENLLEDIEDIARKHLDSAISYLAVILEHLYELEHFKGLAKGETAGRGWVKGVLNARDRLERLITSIQALSNLTSLYQPCVILFPISSHGWYYLISLYWIQHLSLIFAGNFIGQIAIIFTQQEPHILYPFLSQTLFKESFVLPFQKISEYENPLED